MSAKRIIGLIMIVVGMVAFAFGGIFWTDRDTVIDAGPIDITAEHREGMRVPPMIAGAAILAGLVLLVYPERRRT